MSTNSLTGISEGDTSVGLSGEQLERFAKEFYTARKEYFDRRDLGEGAREEIDQKQIGRRDSVRLGLTAPEKAVVAEIEQSLPLSHIGTGSGRAAFRVETQPDKTVRFARYGEYHSESLPREYDGQYQNRHEVLLWEEARGTSAESLLLPILEADKNHLWSVQPTICPLIADNTADYDDTYSAARNLAGEVKQHGLGEYIDTVEITDENVAVYNNTLVVFDYGLPPRTFE